MSTRAHATARIQELLDSGQLPPRMPRGHRQNRVREMTWRLFMKGLSPAEARRRAEEAVP